MSKMKEVKKNLEKVVKRGQKVFTNFDKKLSRQKAERAGGGGG